jgi:hypothetical protein
LWMSSRRSSISSSLESLEHYRSIEMLWLF